MNNESMKKEQYIKPQIEMIDFETEDIITTRSVMEGAAGDTEGNYS